MKTLFSRIRETVRGHKPLTILLMTVMFIACAFSVKALSDRSRAEAAVDGLETAEVTKMDLAQSVTLSGTVQGGELYSAESTLSGVQILTVNVEEGDIVKKGDIIATLDDTQLKMNADAAKKRLSYTQKVGKNNVATAERKLDYAEEDKEITEANGEYSVSVAKSTYKKAVADQKTIAQKYDEAKASAEAKKAEIQPRLDWLYQERQDLMDERQRMKDEGKQEDDPDIIANNTAVDAKDKEIAALEKKYKDLESAASSYETKLKTANNAVDTAYNALLKAKQSAEESNIKAKRVVTDQKAALEKIEIQTKESQLSPKQDAEKTSKELEKSTITAQTDGVVTAVNAKAGDISRNGTVIAYIQDNSTLTVSALADQYEINSLEEGLTAEIEVKAAKQKNLQATLIHVSSTPVVSGGKTGVPSSKASVNYQVVSSVDNSSKKLKVGMDAEIEVKLREKKGVLAVPDECVQTDENGNRYVEVVKLGGRTKRVEVEYGMRTDTYSEISGKGIKEGVKVIIPTNEEETGENGTEN